MKGITPVIAIILLLLITISMVGFAFVWFTRVSELATQQTQAQLEEQLTQQAQKIRIDAVTSTTVTVRNSGSQIIPTSRLTFFVAGEVRTCIPALSANLAIGATVTCTWSGPSCSEGAKKPIKVTAPGGSDSVNCPV